MITLNFFAEIDDGYDGFDESSYTSREALDVDKRRKRVKKRHKNS